MSSECPSVRSIQELRGAHGLLWAKGGDSYFLTCTFGCFEWQNAFGSFHFSASSVQNPLCANTELDTREHKMNKSHFLALTSIEYFG